MKPSRSLSFELQPFLGMRRDSNLGQNSAWTIAANVSCLIFKVDISADLGAEGENDIGGDWDHFNLTFIIPGLVARPGLSDCFS